MPPVLAPPRSTRPDGREGAALDPEALIEEARRRALRRRAAYAVAALLAIGVALGSFFAIGGGGTPTPRRSPAGHPNRGLPQAGTIVDTLPFSARGTVLFAAHARSVFVLVIPPDRARSITVMRVDPDGGAVHNRLPFSLLSYLADVSAGSDGIYAGTAVIKRFTDVPDELVRIDPKTLRIRARVSFPSRVAAVEQGRRLWASTGDGRVMRLDPRTLATETSRRVLSAAEVASGAVVSRPALGLASLWVLAGTGPNLELVRMDPATLAVRSRTRVPTGGPLFQALRRVAADSSHVYLVGNAVATVDANGKIGRPVLVSGLANAEIQGSGLVGLTGGTPALVRFSAGGRILAKLALADAGADLAVSGKETWFLGDAGRGNGIVHVRLAAR